MPLGKVKWCNSKKCYGFITEEETERDIFLHVSELENSKMRVLKEDQKIGFEIKKEKFIGMCNIGFRPTLTNDKEESIEVHIFSGNIISNYYNDTVIVYFLK